MVDLFFLLVPLFDFFSSCLTIDECLMTTWEFYIDDLFYVYVYVSVICNE